MRQAYKTPARATPPRRTIEPLVSSRMISAMFLVGAVVLLGLGVATTRGVGPSLGIDVRRLLAVILFGTAGTFIWLATESADRGAQRWGARGAGLGIVVMVAIAAVVMAQ